MNPQDPTQVPPTAVQNPLSVMQDGEQVVCEIKRHPIGIMTVFIMSGVLLVLALVMAVAAPHFVANSGNQQKVLAIGLLIDLAFSALILAFVWVANKVYWGNRWVVTTDSITQVTQTSLFDKQSSQLS